MDVSGTTERRVDLDILNDDDRIYVLRSIFEGVTTLRLSIRYRLNDWSIRIHKKPDANTALFLLNGAVNRVKSPGPVFQRSTWTDQLDGHVISIADSTLALDTEMSIGWAQGHAGADIMNQAELAILVSESLGVPRAEDRLYFGSSAGGFQALVMSTLDRGSSVMVNNPQVDWTRYHKNVVDRVRSVCHSDRSANALRTDEHVVTNVGEFMAKMDYLPRVHYFVNSASKADMTIHLASLLSSVRDSPGLTRTGNLRIVHYFDKVSGHNPLPKERTVREINSLIEDLNRGKKVSVGLS